tara:strand:- start:1363 stop:1509 length:147 start_codon:yes stop_codon:yes gene_type:complete
MAANKGRDRVLPVSVIDELSFGHLKCFAIKPLGSTPLATEVELVGAAN